MKAVEESIGAFVDGELPADEAAALARRAAQDEDLAREIDRQRLLRGRLRDAYAPVIEEPVPARLTRQLAEPPRPRLVSARPPVRALAYGLGLAASLVLAVGVTLSLRPAGDVAFSSDGAAIARGELARALDSQLGAGAASANSAVRVMASFRTPDGRYCRLFQRRGETTTSGLACRGEAGWTLAALGTGEAQTATPFRQASSSLPPAVVASLDEIGASQPLSAAEEQAAQRAHWRASPRP